MQKERVLSLPDEKIKIILDYLKQLENAKQDDEEFKDRPRIGFRK